VVFVFFRHDPPQSLILFIALSQITQNTAKRQRMCRRKSY